MAGLVPAIRVFTPMDALVDGRHQAGTTDQNEVRPPDHNVQRL